MSSSSNNYYNSNVNNINNEAYPFSLYLSSLSNHEADIISNPYNNHQLIASPNQMVSAVPESLNNYMAFSSSNNVDVSKRIKKPVKKDRHSKIYTAQGLRDRRVRLSIGIARQFFDLQDMLGFDKASKTLDWLLKKSRNSIQEVVEAKRVNNSIIKNNDGDLEDNEEDEEEEEDEDKSSSVEYWEDVVFEVKEPEKRNILSKGKEKTTESENLNPFLRSINEREEKLSISVLDSDMRDYVYKEAFEEFNGFPRKEISNQESILPKRKIDLPMEMGQSYNQQSYTILNQNLGFDYDQNSSIDQPFCSLGDMSFGRGFS